MAQTSSQGLQNRNTQTRWVVTLVNIFFFGYIYFVLSSIYIPVEAREPDHRIIDFELSNVNYTRMVGHH